MKTVKNINYCNDLYMDLFLPKKEEFYTFIHFHGGGLVEGDKGDTHQYCEHLAKCGYAVATANYSLLPDHKFPSFIRDAAKAVKYMMDNISKYGRCKGFIISGQSAGAYLTLMLCLNKEYLQEVGINNNDILGYVSDAGQPTTHFHILEIEQGLDPKLQRIDETAPLYYVNKETKFNGLLLITYTNDLENRLEQNKLLVSSIKSFNKDLNVKLEVLEGYHCQGSSELDKDGEYPVIKVINEWMKTL